MTRPGQILLPVFHHHVKNSLGPVFLFPLLAVVKGHDSRVALEFLQKLDFVPESLGLDFCRVPGLVTSFNIFVRKCVFL